MEKKPIITFKPQQMINGVLNGIIVFLLCWGLVGWRQALALGILRACLQQN